MKKWLSYASSSNWLRVVGVATIVLVGAYTMVQQATRLSANDLPLQTAQTIKHQLASGMTPAKAVPTVQTDLASDSTVFAIITDNSYKVVASSATLDGNANITPPQGTFAVAAQKGSNWFTWQPKAGVREAVEMLKYDNGYIIAGQSLKPYEDRTNTYGWITLAAWIAVVIWTTFIPIPARRK